MSGCSMVGDGGEHFGLGGELDVDFHADEDFVLEAGFRVVGILSPQLAESINHRGAEDATEGAQGDRLTGNGGGCTWGGIESLRDRVIGSLRGCEFFQ